MTIGFHEPNGMLLTATCASPVPFIASPSANPPATIHITSQSMSLRSSPVIILVKAKTAMGSMATVLALMPTCFPNIQSSMVATNVTATT